MLPATEDRWNRLAGWLLLVFAAALPHSIAIAEGAAAAAALVWLAAHLLRWRRLPSTPLDLPVSAYLLATALAAAFSLEPEVSAAKLGGAALILIVPVAANVITTRRQAVLLVCVLLGSAGVGAAIVVWEKAVGRGVEIVALTPDSPLRKRLQRRDVLLSCDHQPLAGPADFERVLAAHDPSTPLGCDGIRGGLLPFQLKVPPRRIPPERSLAAWGVEVTRGRSLRARGTYSHSVTYAEMLLQLTALLGGLWLACGRKRSAVGAALVVAGLLLAVALAATFTRASWAALVVAGLAMLGMRLGWRWSLLMLGPAATTLAGANWMLVRWRGVGFYDPADTSMQYRRLMWADGWRLIREHPLLGIGMDSVLTRWRELGIRAYEQFGLVSHFHSTPIQIGVERGLVGLAAWLLLMVLYVRLLARLVGRTRAAADWWEHGLALGIFGAAVGFLASGLVHYNFGDSEVVMVFWLLCGVTLALDRLARPEGSGEERA